MAPAAASRNSMSRVDSTAARNSDSSWKEPARSVHSVSERSHCVGKIRRFPPVVRLVRVFAPTHVTTDAANFRAIVQSLTGADAVETSRPPPQSAAADLVHLRRLPCGCEEPHGARQHSTAAAVEDSGADLESSGANIPIEEKRHGGLPQLEQEASTAGADCKHSDDGLMATSSSLSTEMSGENSQWSNSDRDHGSSIWTEVEDGDYKANVIDGWALNMWTESLDYAREEEEAELKERHSSGCSADIAMGDLDSLMMFMTMMY